VGFVMEAGKLDRTITVQRLIQAVAPSGAVSKTWSNLSFGEAARQTVVFLVRWHPSPITTGDRILYAGRTYDLKEIVEIGRRKGWQLRAVAA
jgi:head-tail adaptor